MPKTQMNQSLLAFTLRISATETGRLLQRPRALFHLAEASDNFFGDGSNDAAFVAVAQGKRHEDEARAMGQFNISGVVTRLARPSCLRPEFRPPRQSQSC